MSSPPSKTDCVTNFDGNFELATSYPWTINLNKYELDDDTDVLSYPLCPYEHGHDCGPDQAYGVVHPYYDSIIDHDFALLFLPDDVPDIQPVQLNADPNLPVDGDVLDTFGWGETEFGSPNVPYTVDLHYVPNEQCIAYPYRWPADLITPSMLCAIDEGKDTCYGDSGECIYCVFYLRGKNYFGSSKENVLSKQITISRWPCCSRLSKWHISASR